MANLDQEHYQISLSPQPAPTPPTPGKKTVTKPLAGRGTRLVAYLMDCAVGLSPLVLGYAITQGWAESPQTSMLRLRFWACASLAFVAAQMILLSLRGQTLGKMAMGVRIVDCDTEDNPGFFRAVVLRSIVPGLISAFPCLGTLFALANTLFIFGEERRCIHDLFAGTKVVQA
jgi:uncharacterized RDD family membrane protein YckC